MIPKEILAKLKASQEQALANNAALALSHNWRIGNLRPLCHSAQHVIYDSFYANKFRDVVILASRRFGKSFLGFVLCLEHCLRHANSITRFIPPEIEQAKMIGMTTMGKLMRSCPDGLIEPKKADNAWKVGDDSWIFLGGFDSQRDSQRGGEAGLIVADEAGSTNEFQYRYMLRSVLKPQLLTTRGHMVHMGTPPPNLDHPFLTETLLLAEEEGRCHTFTIDDNPMLDDEQRAEAIKDCGGVDTEDYQREYLCMRVKSMTRTVIPEFGDHNIVEMERPEYARWIISLDNGGVRDLTCVVLGFYDFLRAKKCIWDELKFNINTSTEEIAMGVAEMLQRNNIYPQDWYGDASGQTLIDLNNIHKMNFLLPLKDDVDAAINDVRLKCKSSKIEIHPRCAHTIRTLSYGLWNEKRTDFLRTETLGHNDAIMAVCYMNRMMDTTENPYPEKTYHRDTTFYRPKISTEQQIANALVPKNFMKGRRTDFR